MRVSNAAGQNWRQNKIFETQRGKNAAFSDLLKKETEGYHLDTSLVAQGAFLDEELKKRGIDILCLTSHDEGVLDPEHIIHFKNYLELIETNNELSKRFPHCSFPMQADPVEVDLSGLTDEKKEELNEKYQIDSIKPYSDEYFALIKDLQEEGILSGGNAYYLPPHVVNTKIDEDGAITGFVMQYFGDSAEKWNFFGYTRDTLIFSSEEYEKMIGKDTLTGAEQAVVSIHESHQNIMTAIEEIFSSQLNPAR